MRRCRVTLALQTVIDRFIYEGREIRLLNRRLAALMIAIIRKKKKKKKKARSNRQVALILLKDPIIVPI